MRYAFQQVDDERYNGWMVEKSTGWVMEELMDELTEESQGAVQPHHHSAVYHLHPYHKHDSCVSLH